MTAQTERWEGSKEAFLAFLVSSQKEFTIPVRFAAGIIVAAADTWPSVEAEYLAIAKDTLDKFSNGLGLQFESDDLSEADRFAFFDVLALALCVDNGTLVQPSEEFARFAKAISTQQSRDFGFKYLAKGN